MAVSPLQSGDPPAAALRELISHHDQLQGELRARLDSLADVVAHGGDVTAKRRALRGFLKSRVLPYIGSEESTIYIAGASRDHLAALVEGLRREHSALAQLAEELFESTTAPETLAAASAFLALFEVHAEIENDVLLPVLLDAGANPKELLNAMTDALQNHTNPAPTPNTAGIAAHSGEQVVDTRIHEGGSCASLATTAVDGLAVGASFVLVADHDPRGINYMLRAERPGATSWDVLEDGPERWQVRIGRTSAAA